VPGRIIVAVGDDRLWQPLADVALAAGARGAQLVDRQPGGHGRDERPRRHDPLAAVQRLMHPQEGLLDNILGLGHAAEHPVGDLKRARAQLVKQSLAIGHADHSTPCWRDPFT
jgi:hypothetical protein